MASRTSVESEGPEQGDALGRGEGQVVAGSSSGLHCRPRALPGGGHPGQEVAECLGIDLADQPEPLGRRPDPLTRRLAPAEVVVVDVVGHLVEVVVGAAGSTELVLSRASQRSLTVASDTDPWLHGPDRRHPERHPRHNALLNGMHETRQRGRNPVEYAAVALNECRCVDMIRTACGGADLLSHPGARGGLDARLGASLDPRDGCELPDPIVRGRTERT